MKRTKNDAVRRENKEALPKLLLLLVCSIAVGFLVGLGMAFLDDGNLRPMLLAAGESFSIHVAPWMLCACPVILLLVNVFVRLVSRAVRTIQDNDDEVVTDRVECGMSICLWLSNMMIILAMFLLAASYTGFMASDSLSKVMLFAAIGAFLLTLILSVLLQQKLIDLTKRANPEKRGSVYDLRFQKKWFNSCDEAERAIIGRCAYKAYSAVNTTCLVLWVIFTAGGLFLNSGFLPVLAVCVVWAVGQSVYCYWAIRSSTPGSPVL